MLRHLEHLTINVELCFADVEDGVHVIDKQDWMVSGMAVLCGPHLRYIRTMMSAPDMSLSSCKCLIVPTSAALDAWEHRTTELTLAATASAVRIAAEEEEEEEEKIRQRKKCA